ncbi:divalent-cation tolerance protein CutA [Halobacterium rubrum]|uniref:divalent-cation tolerance protein CutA n=1 Tax=Halobacterium TaxID=2239 RepID=UPI001F21DAEB|nr:divalent-cation tolerance protein CutA [Halobacterium rubrum]MDH5021352.1 divalent-cation tolerance protein CutA [Halobacterium rubrum]
MPTVYITVPRDVAAPLAADLVERRLAACVNRLDCQSTYRWDGDVVHDEAEVVLLAKTTDDAYDDLVAFVEREHPYDVPCIERFDDADALPAFADWLDDAVA